MSTKTTFKRIALVTVAAMGFGLLSVVPSTATSQSDSLAVSAATSTISAGSTYGATITLTQSFLGANGDTMTVIASIESAPTGNSVVPSFADNPGLGVSIALPITSTGLTAVMMDTVTSNYAVATAVYSVNFRPTIGGTYVVKFTPYNGDARLASAIGNPTSVAARAAAVTWTVTVPSQTVGDATSTLDIRAGSVSTGSAATVSVAVGSTSVQAANITVTPLNTSLVTTGSTIITATLSGPGTLGAGAASNQATTGTKLATYSPGTAAAGYVTLWSDGTSGTSTVTVSINGLVIGTNTVTFTGAAASVTATLVKPTIAAGSTATAGVISATVKDAAGNGVSGVTLYAVSSGSSVVSTSVTTGSAGVVLIPLVGAVAGTNTVTVRSAAAGSTATYSATAVSVRVGSGEASAVTMTLDKATYTAGELATVTVTIKDAAGNAVIDGSYSAFAAAVTSTRALAAGSLPLATVSAGSNLGVATYLVNVPSTKGAFTISALPASGLLGAGSAVAISATATVGDSAADIAAADAVAAAADAAAEATDAANAATDAANAAAAAAQDAADAVATLSTQVATLIADLKAQLTALTNLVIKIQKKVKA